MQPALTKGQRRRLRELAGLAHERELATELARLEAEFVRWRAGAIDAHELSDRIHAFHQGAARKLYVGYAIGDPRLAVASAIARGILSEQDAGPDLTSVL